MASGEGSERRHFVRVNVDVPVSYKFVPLDPRMSVAQELHNGYSRNISQGGLLLIGRLPNLSWISPLLMSRMIVAVSLQLPQVQAPVKALCRAAWLETVEEKSQRAAFGLIFNEIANEDRDRVLHFVLKSQI